MKQTVKIEGLRELDAALGELPKSTGKNVLRRVLREVGEPMAQTMRDKAPIGKNAAGVPTMALVLSIMVGPRLSRRQAGLYRKMFRDDRAAVEMHVGPGPLPEAITQEFGTWFHRAQPFARPAWDQHKMSILENIKGSLANHIAAAAARIARKQARLIAKNQQG